LRGIREQERYETRAEFAEAMARVAREIGEQVYPDTKYVQRLESGDITWPNALYRNILVKLCGRPASELGFTPPSISARDPARASGEVPASVNVPLRDAVWASGMELAGFARKVGVDPKTAERWITRGRIPHPRHRWKASEILGRDESELWPELAMQQKRVQQDAAPERSPAIKELSGMLTDYGFALDRFGSAHGNEVWSLADLERDMRIAFEAYQQSRFTIAASRISTLLADAELAARDCREADRARIQRILALSYQAAASVLTKVGETDLAWIAAERGLNAAENSGSPSVRGSLIRSVAFALHSTSRFEPAMRLVDASADSLYKGIAGNDAMLSVYGTLLLVGSMAAARFGDGSRTAGYLREASSAAQRLGRDGNHLWTSFGPTNVAIHRVNTAVELGDFQTVLDSGLSLSTVAVPAERRVRYLLDVARVYALTGNRDDALGAMLTAERMAPEQVHQHYLSGRVVMTLIRGLPGKPAPELNKLATRVKACELS
jgi:hypothetical protein